MNRPRLVAGCIALLVTASGGGAPARASSPEPAARTCGALAAGLVEDMALREKIGQMVMVLNAPAFGDFTDTAGLIRDHHVGSVVSHAYFGLDAATAAAHNNALQTAAAQTRLGVPVLNAADVEAGVTILVAEATSLPTQLGLGAAERRRHTRVAAGITAEEATALGFDWAFAPLADVLTTPLNGEDGVRSFGGRTGLTSRLVATEVKTFQSGGLIATAKHFPGMGGSEVNSHFDLPRVSYDRETLRRTHLRPFRAAIRAGVDTVMTGHIVVEAVDPHLPASMSRAVTTGLLRNRLGFDGVVVTDSMTLGGVVSRWGIGEAAVLAVQAGADIVMEIGPTEVPLLAIEALVTAVDDGTIRMRRIDASVRRVLSLKCRYGLFEDPFVDLDRAVVGAAADRETGAHLSREGTTLVRNDGILPFSTADGGTTLVAGVTHPTDAVIGMPPTSHVPALAAAVEQVSGGTAVAWAAGSEDPSDEEIAAAVELAAGADRILVATYADGALPAGQARLVDALLATGKPLVAVATGTPYDLAAYPDVGAYVAAPALSFLPAYLYSSSLLDAAVAVVFGAQPGGRLPVPIPGLYPVGHGLRYTGP